LKIWIVQRFFAHYRADFFLLLHQKLALQGHDLQIVYSFALGREEIFPWSRRVPGFKLKIQIGEITEYLVFTPRLLAQLAEAKPDLLILEDISSLPNSLLCAAYCRLKNKPYLVWGLGQIPAKKRSVLHRFLNPFIHFLHSNAAGFIGYSSHAVKVYSAHHRPVYFAPNSILDRPSVEHYQAVLRQIEKKYQEAEIHLVAIGALRRQKRFDLLITLLERLDLCVHLHIIGSGSEMPRLLQLTEERRLQGRVRFHGAVYGLDDKRQIFSKCHLGLLPGRGGLAIQELFYYGIPVLSGVADGTESDLIQNGINGFLCPALMDEETLFTLVRGFINKSIFEKKAMAVAAVDAILNRQNISRMADGFLQAVNDISRRNLRV
jgi:glycosyltransferase involved in cell wall biosynthesis